MCSELQDLAIQDLQELNVRIQNITDRAHSIILLLSDVVHKYGDEIKIKLEHADEMIESWSDLNADGGQLKLTWENIRSAAKGLHALFVALKVEGGEQ